MPVAGKYTRSGLEILTVRPSTCTSVAGAFATGATVPAPLRRATASVPMLRSRDDHPQMTVRIGEGAHVAPRLRPRARNDGRPGRTRPSDQIVDGDVGLGGEIDDGAGLGDL